MSLLKNLEIHFCAILGVETTLFPIEFLQANNDNNKDFFNPQSGAFWPSFIALSVALVVILVFGIFFEFFRRAVCCKGR